MNEKYIENLYIASSNIHGKGLFIKSKRNVNSILGIGIYYFMKFIPIITKEVGCMINHSYNPNTKLVYNKDKNIFMIVAKKNIEDNSEITINYNDTPWFISKPFNSYR